MTTDEAIIVLKNINDLFGAEYENTNPMIAIEMAIEALKRERWIPVSSVIPEDLYLIDTYSNITMAYYQNGYWIEYLTEEIILKTTVRAYRPLPEPYKENNKGF